MPIASQVVIYNRPQRIGRRVRYGFTDHTGKVHEIEKRIASSVDVDADMTAHALIIEQQLINGEIEAAIYAPDVLDATQNPSYATSKQIAKYLIRLMIRERDPRIVLILEPLINYLRSNYNAAQLRNFLDVTNAQLTKINTKIDAVLNNKADLQLFDSESGELDG